MEEIAEVYARSLFEVAMEHDVLDRVHDELGEFAEALGEVDFSTLAKESRN